MDIIPLLIWIAIFIVSMAVLIKSSDFFTTAAEKIGISLKIPPFIVGVTIVAVGTSLPELVSSLVAVLIGSSEIVLGNVAGSNITNIFLILGCTAIMAGDFKLSYDLNFVDLPILLASSFLMAMMVWDGNFSIFEALLSLAALVVYMGHAVHAARSGPSVREEKDQDSVDKIGPRPWLLLGLSGIFVYLGARFTVESIVRISNSLGIGTALVAASVVALGTSLPELAVSISAARKGNPELAVGNVLGSNIFNTFAVMGIPALFGKLTLPRQLLVRAVPIMVVATLIFYFMTEEKKIIRWEGWMLLIFYLFYLSSLFGLV